VFQSTAACDQSGAQTRTDTVKRSAGASQTSGYMEKIVQPSGADGGRRASDRVGGFAQPLQQSAPGTADALSASQAQVLAAIVESSDDAIVSKDLNGIVATWNRGAEKLFGYQAHEVVGNSITMLFPAELQDEEVRILARIKRGERIEHFETVRQRKDGSRIQVSLTVSPIRDAGGRIVGASKIARDITSRKRVEDAQAAVFEFTDRLFRAGSAHDVYEAALDAMIRALGCNRASILLFDEGGIMRFAAWRGLSEAYRQAVEGHSPWTRQSKDPSPIIVSDIEAAELDAALKDTIRAEGIAALAFMPLIAHGELVGKFMTYYLTPHKFTEADMNIAVTIARQLGFSVERMRAEKERITAERAKELLLNESTHRIKNTLGTIQAMAGQTLRGANPDELQSFLARLRALGEAHELLASENWHRASLLDVVGRAVKPFAPKQEERFVVNGSTVWVSASTSLNLTLCLHELATNAIKYGALSNGTGQVRVSCEVMDELDGRKLQLTWKETGGPPVSAPKRHGFGSLLITSTGEEKTRIDYQPDGVRCFLELSL